MKRLCQTITSSLAAGLAAIGVFISRLSLLPANVSFLGSFGFFGGNLLAFFASIIGFDLLVGGLYKGFVFTYLGFFSYYLLGKIARHHLKRQLVLLPTASFLFFLISNLGVWFYWYPQTWEGLLACYLAAVPFYKNTLLGDLVFGYSYLAIKALVAKKSLTENLAQKLLTEERL